MQVTQITVNAGRTLPHPNIGYANLRPSVTLTASLDATDDPATATRQLQAMAEQLVEQHAVVLVASIEERAIVRLEEEELQRLTKSIQSNQGRFEELQERQKQREARAGSQSLLFDNITPSET